MKTQCFHQIPPIVKIVLHQGAKLHSEGLLRSCNFEAQIKRLKLEELEPRGFLLTQRKLSGGGIRFSIKAAATGKVCETIMYCPDRQGISRGETMTEDGSF
jgi:hypothetical protein